MDEMLLSLSRPYGWRDEHGRQHETIPSPRCGLVPLLDPTAEVMRLLKLRPYQETSYVNWCGHKVDFISVLRGDGGCKLIPLVGEAT